MCIIPIQILQTKNPDPGKHILDASLTKKTDFNWLFLNKGALGIQVSVNPCG